MSKRVILTWLRQGMEEVEEVFMMEPTDAVYVASNGEMRELEGIMQTLTHTGMEVFEDEQSMFMLPKEQIVRIDVIGEV